MAQLGIRRSNQRRGTGYWPTYAASAGGFYGSPGEARRAAASVPTGLSGWWDRLPPWQKAILILGGGAVAGELAAPLLPSGTGHAGALPAGTGAGTAAGGGGVFPPSWAYATAAARGATASAPWWAGPAKWAAENVRVGSSAPQDQYQMPDRGHAELLAPTTPTLAGWEPRAARTSAGIPPELVLQLLARERGIPEYQWGTPWHRGGAALIGERGPEIVNLPRGASVDPFADIPQPEYFEPEPVQVQGGWERLAAGLGEQPFSASVDVRQPGAGLGLLLAALAGYANYRTGRAARGLKARATAAEEVASVRTKASQKRYESQLAAAEKIAGREEKAPPSARAPKGFEAFGIAPGTPIEVAESIRGTTELRERATGTEEAPRLTAGGLDAAAKQWASTGNMVAAGMGKAGTAMRAKIINRSAELYPELNVGANRAIFEGTKSSLTALRKIHTSSQAFTRTALRNADVLEASIDQMINLGSPLINRPARALQNITGDPAVGAFNAALGTVGPEFARLLTAAPSGSGVTTDTAREELNRILSRDATPAQMKAALKVLRREAQGRTASYETEIRQLEEELRRPPGSPPGAPVDLSKPLEVVRDPTTGKLRYK